MTAGSRDRADADSLTGDTAPLRVAVVGSGIAGLAAAARVLSLGEELGREVRLAVYEAADRSGGHILTERTPEGFLIEGGPDCFVSQKPAGMRLAGDSGLDIRSTAPVSTTFVLSDGRLHPLPEGTMLMVPTKFLPLARSGLLTWPGKLRMGLDLALPRGGVGDESLGDFVRRRLGDEALEKIAEPLVAGVHAGDPDRLSLVSTFPRFKAMETDHRSLILAMVQARRARVRSARTGASRAATSGPSAFVTVEGGLDRLIAALVASLPAGSLRLATRVTSIEAGAAGPPPGAASVERYRLRLGGPQGERTEEADVIVLAVAAHEAAAMVAPLHAGLSSELGGIDAVSAVTVTLGLRRGDVAHPLHGFGLVIPRRERRRIMGVTWSSSKFPGRAPEGHVLLRVFVGGVKRPAVLEMDDEALQAMVLEEVGDLLALTGRPVTARLFRWPRSMPQYNVGHQERLARIDQALTAIPGLALAGGSYRGVGIPDCIQSGWHAAERLLSPGVT